MTRRDDTEATSSRTISRLCDGTLTRSSRPASSPQIYALSAGAHSFVSVTGARKGLLYDGLFDDWTCATLLAAMRDDREIPMRMGRLRGTLVQELERGVELGLLERAVVGGFHPASSLVRDRRFDPVRGMADFRQILRRADELNERDVPEVRMRIDDDFRLHEGAKADIRLGSNVGAVNRTVELIQGEIVQMSPIGRRHVAFVDNLTQLLVTRLAGRAIVSVQNPVALSDDTEPQPDLKVLRRRAVPYKDREAWGEDVLLLIEVAETSLAYDRSTKLRLYAEAGIPEYWVVDCAAESIEIHRTPEGGRYGGVTRVTGADATASPEAFPDVVLTLAEIFA